MSTTTMKKSTLTDAFPLWEKKSKSGNTYYQGEYGGLKLTAFVNTKKDMKDPDLVVYRGNLVEKKVYLKFWANVSKAGKKYLSCKLEDGTRMLGFYNEKQKTNPNQPAIRFYITEKDDV